MNWVYNTEQAVISYIGSSSPIECSEAIIDCLARGDKPERAVLLSAPLVDGEKVRRHGFFLEFERIGWFVVSPAYASGYGGSGPEQLSKILSLLNRTFDNIFEYEIEQDAFHRLKQHQLLDSDIDSILQPIRRTGSKIFLQDYIYKEHYDRVRSLFTDFSARLPLTMLHPDLADIALDIFTDPIGTIREACTILEQSLKDKSNIKESGSKLFDAALKPRVGKLLIKDCEDNAEQSGLQFMAKGFYQLHRNPIMHKSSKSIAQSTKDSISVLLVANHLLLQFSRLIENPDYVGTD